MIDSPRAQIDWKQLEQLPHLVGSGFIISPPQASTSRKADSSSQTNIIKEGLLISVPICSRLPLIAYEPLQYKEWVIPAGVSLLALLDILSPPILLPGISNGG